MNAPSTLAPAPAPGPTLVVLAELEPSVRAALLARVRTIATDIDGTLTHGRALDPEVVRVIAALARKGLRIVPVSGRPAGEVLGLCRYLPGVVMLRAPVRSKSMSPSTTAVSPWTS